MVDPQMKEKVRSKLRSTLTEAEGIVVEAATKIEAQTTRFSAAILKKCNGGNGHKPCPVPIAPSE